MEIQNTQKIKTITGAESVIKCLIEEGVTTLFGYPGGAIMPVYDAMYDYQNQIKHILVRHEQGAIHAAQGYARASGEVGVCIATSGPGATNLITGLADAMIDSTPIVCITGQVSSKLLGTDAFQETDVIGITMPITKWNFQVAKTEAIPAAIAKAFYIARSGRPGPVLIDITKDAQFGEATFNYSPCKKIRSYSPQPELKMERVKQAATLINQAKKPFLLVGQGVLLSKAEKELVAFVEKSGIPVASTLLGLGALSTDHPLYTGFLGMHGNYAPNIKTNECDVLIGVGLRFDDRVTGEVTRYAKQAKIIHIDIDSAEINKIIKTEVAIHADAKEALVALTKQIEKKEHPRWLNEFKECAAKEHDTVIKHELPLREKELKMASVVNMLSEKTKGEAIIVTDVGQHQMVTSRYYQYKKSNSNITSGGLGTMGFALPAAIGAKLGSPARPVIAIIGDGGFQMTIQELGTILQSHVAVKIIILNNNFLGMVRQWQELFFDKRYSATEIVNPNFTAIAKAYSIEAERVDNPQVLSTAMDKMLEHQGAYLLEVIVEKEENVFPMVPQGASVAEIRLK
jgi:acetolactate synthase I/II/III large subunit